MQIKPRILLSLLALTLAACGGQDGTNADNSGSDAATAEHTYAGENITVVIGLDASAGGTTLGRLLAKHLEKNLKGNPTVVVNNMPGAATLNAHLHVLLKAPKDGNTVYYGPRSSLGELLELPGYSFKYTDFTPLGGVQVAGLVVYTRTDATAQKLTRPEDTPNTDSPLLFGGMSPHHGRMIISTMALDLIGADYKYIAGYPSSGSVRAAVISGEVNTGTDAAHSYLNQVVPVLVEPGDAIAVFSLPTISGNGELVKNSLLPDVPSLPDLYESIHGDAPSGTNWDAIKTLLELDQTMQHVFLGPPGMDAAASATFREGLMKTMTSAEFRDEALKVLSYTPGYVDAERQHEILGATADVEPDVLAFIEENIKKNSGR